MFGSSKNKDEVFYGSFRDHAQAAVEASDAFVTMLGDPSTRESAVSVITAAEKRGSAIQRRTLKELHGTWITPFERHHIHELALGLGGILDLIESTSARLVCFDIRESREGSRDLGHSVHEACAHVHAVTELLPKLSKSTADDVMRHAGEIHAIEGRADVIHRQALTALFDGSSDPLTVMKWRDVFDGLEQTTDICQELASLFEAIVLENA